MIWNIKDGMLRNEFSFNALEGWLNFILILTKFEDLQALVNYCAIKMI